MLSGGTVHSARPTRSCAVNKSLQQCQQLVKVVVARGVSECVDLYSALSLRTPDALDALVSREQERFN